MLSAGIVVGGARRGAATLVVVLLSVLCLGAFASVAQAGKGVASVFGTGGNGDGQFDTPQGIAIDQSTGDVYVVDGNNNRVERFNAGGVYQSQFGVAGNGDGQFSGPQGIAVDPSDGSVYVADTGGHRVEKFDNAAVYQSQFGSEGSGDGQFEGPTRVAVDSAGQVYVLDSGNGRIERFTSAGAFDQVFDSTDVLLPQEIAVGPGNDDLYVAQSAQDFSEQRVVEIDSAGSLVDTHAVGSTASNSSGLALNSGSQRIYLADGFNARVFILDDVSAPTVSIDPAANVASTSASLSGSVTPNGDPAVGWHFETSTDDANWSPVAGDQDAGNGNSPVPVTQDLTGLVPNTTYFGRLAATQPFNLATFSSEVQFSTPAVGPDATTEQAFDMTPTQATVQGEVHPHNSPTTYFFEYGTTTAYGASAPTTQDANAGSADGPGTVYRRLGGLQQGTTYHYRLVATNQAGTVHGADQSFTTTVAPPHSTARAGIPGSPFLPDQRGFEKVSPDDKNGGDIMADAGRTRLATDGSAANFASLAGFGDAIGTSVATDYVSLRGAGGWATHAITPHQASTTYLAIVGGGLQSLYLGLSSDLAKGVFVGWSPVTNDPNVAAVANLYLRNDPKTPGAGSYQLLSACPLCAATSSPLPPLLANINGGGQPRFEGASTDFGHVVFGSQQPLTSDAPSGCANLQNVNQCPANLYEWDHGTLRLVGILPDSECGGTPPCSAHGSQAGQDSGPYQGTVALAPHTISADGSRIFFTVPSQPRSASGALYMRVGHSTTVRLNTSERASPDPTPDQPARYWDASTDGQRVFFTTGEALTDDAPVNGDQKLYTYDASKPDSDSHNLTLISADSQPADGGDVVNVQGASSNGHYVYFAAAGQLLAGEPVADRMLYVWHDGTIRPVAAMEQFLDKVEDTNTISWTFNRPTARVTPDGVHLLFSSTLPGAGPTGYDQGNCHALEAGCRELYLYSYDSQRVACVSCNPTGALATTSAFTAERLNTGVSATSPAQNHPLTDDGRHVFFGTAEALVPDDTNGRVDVYEYDAPSGTVRLITTGTARSDSYFMDASPSGNDALFLTRAQLAGADSDNSYDLYDARVGGGFPEPLPSPPVCSSDACQGPQGSVPDAVTPGSSLTGPNPGVRAHTRVKPKPKAKCRKGYVRKKVRGKVRCVKKRKARAHKKVSKANRSRPQRRAK